MWQCHECDMWQCDMTQVRAGNELTLESWSCMWPQRAGAGRDSEPPERRTGLQSTGTSGESSERVSATLWAPLLLLIMKQCHGWQGWQFDQGNKILNIYPRRVANWYSGRCWWSDNKTIIKIRMMALNPPWPRMTHLGLLTLNQVLLILSIHARSYA